MEIITILEKTQDAILLIQSACSFLFLYITFLNKEEKRINIKNEDYRHNEDYIKYQKVLFLITIINIVCYMIIEAILRSH